MDDLQLRKRPARGRILLTGGTGFLGSHLAAGLLERGFEVCCLARPAKDQSGEARIAELMNWLGVPAQSRRRLRVVEGDITLPSLGLDAAAYDAALRETDEVVHCASCTSFSERKRPEVEAVNIGGLARVLEFARAGRTAFFHHVSTAFVAGTAVGSCLEEPAAPPGFHNVYEETKLRGEQAVTAACAEAGIGLAIYRPSIVYGDSRTGRSLLFNAVYYPVRAALIIKELFEKDVRENGGRKAAEMGVTIENDGTVNLPLRIETAPGGGLNLVPVNFFVEAFLALMEDAPEGGIFHIVNERPKTIEDLIDYGCRLFRIRGITACGAAAFAERPRTALESLYDHYLEVYRPYMRDLRVFGTARSRPILDRHDLSCPEMDYDVFARCMRFAVEAGWGTKLFGNRG